MSIREKLLDFKRRLSDRKMYSLVIVLIGAVAVWGLYQYKHAANLRQQLDNQYNRSFYDMVGYVNNVETLLAKALITGTPAKTATTLQEAWRQANLAQENLGQLPISQPAIANTSKFLTQLGDFSYSLNNRTIRGNSLSDDQYRTLERLHGYAVSLGKTLGDLQGQLGAGRIKWNELENKGQGIFQRASVGAPAQQFENIDKTFQDYPTLIYDGPFSDHMVTAEPRGVTGDQINSEQAKQRVMQIFGANRVKSVMDTGRNDAGPIKTYSYSVLFKDTPEDRRANIDVTQKGGHIFWMLYDRPVNEKKIDMNKAKELGRKFLETHGYPGMVDTYYLAEDNTATINYAFQQNNVVIYPDLIKLKIALDNGEIIGIEARSYLSAHTARQIPAPKVTMEQARKKINARMEVLGSGLAMIPTDYRSELFCYEFKGVLNKQEFIVYINALTGEEEDILMIVNTPNGTLTM